MEESLPSTSSEIPPELPEDLPLSAAPVTDEPKPDPKNEKPLNMSAGAVKLRSWLNKSFKVEMTDGRILIGTFLCSDRDANIILGSCSEYLPTNSKYPKEEPRMLGLVMIPGKHIINLHIDSSEYVSALKNRVIKDVATSKEVM